MALKMDRQNDAYELGYFLNQEAERGCILSVATGGSGVALDSPANVATVAGAASGQRPLGVLMNDFVNSDPTRVSRNWFKDEHRPGDKCTILTKGWVVTNFVTGNVAAGDTALLGPSGTLVGAAPGTATTTGAPRVGQFRSGKSEEGFAKVYIDL